MEEKTNKENNKIKRENLLQEISSQKEKYISIFDSIKTDFLNKYENFYSKLSEELKQKDANNIKYLNQGEEIDNYTKKVIENLQKILENLKENHKKFSEDIQNLCNNSNNQIWNQNLKEIDNYINLVLEQKEKQKKLEDEQRKMEEQKQKKLEEENQKKIEEEKSKKIEEEKLKKIEGTNILEEEEEKKKQLEEENKIKFEEEKNTQLEQEKRKKIEDEKEKMVQENNKNLELEGKKEIKLIEFDGKNNKEININLLSNINNSNKIIIKDMSKEDLESILDKKNIKRKSEIKDLEEIHNKLNLEGAGQFQRNATFSKINLNNNVLFGEENGFNSITDIIFKNSDLENIKINELFPNLINLKIKNSKIDFYMRSKKFDLKNLQSLKLENIGLIDNNFNDLFDFIRSNEQIRNNLRVFSVKNNRISYIDYKRGYADNILSSMIFNNLEVLDMSYNKLYYFQNQMFNCLENIKFIDLTDNNISNPNNITGLIKSAKIKKCLLLITRNLGVLKEPENLEYNNYLKEIIPKITNIKYPIKKIIFDNIFCDKLYENIQNLDFTYFKDSLIYVDLSNGQLKDKDMIDLLDNKLPFSNLKTLILIANHLTEEFLYTLSSNDKYSMDKLKVLKLSENDIKCTDPEKFKKFLEFFKNLEILELKCTPFESIINQYFKQKIINDRDPNNRKGLTRKLNKDETNIEEILDKHYLKEKTKLKIHILDLSGGKYTEKIYQNFPILTEGLDIENKFPQKPDK